MTKRKLTLFSFVVLKGIMPLVTKELSGRRFRAHHGIPFARSLGRADGRHDRLLRHIVEIVFGVAIRVVRGALRAAFDLAIAQKVSDCSCRELLEFSKQLLVTLIIAADVCVGYTGP